MGLRDLPLPKARIEIGESSFEVRGLALNDLMLAIQDYGPQMALMFARVTSDEAALSGSDMAGIIMELLREFPDLLAAVIALAADDFSDETVQIAKRFPLPKQVETIEAIFGLTFTSEGEVKKLLESLARMLERVTETLTMAKAPPSVAGIGASAAA